MSTGSPSADQDLNRTGALPRYSVCITNYNKGWRARPSFGRLFSQIDGRFEVVVVDNLSTDESRKVLQELASRGLIELFEIRSRRGYGREQALDKSKGQYVISGLDTDDSIVSGRLSKLLAFYHSKCEGMILPLHQSGFVVGPSPVLREVGGWRDLMFSENWDVCERAARKNKFLWTFFKVKEIIEPCEAKAPGLLERHRARYTRYRDELMLRRRPFLRREKFRVGGRVDYSLARLSTLGRKRLDSAGDDFDDYAPECYVDSSPWWLEPGQDYKEEGRWYRRAFGKAPAWEQT